MINLIISYIFSISFANFICVAAVLVYLIKTQLIPTIDQGIKEKEDAKRALKELAEKTQQACQSVQESTEEQKLYAQELLSKLKMWNESIEQAQEDEARKRLKGIRAISALVKRQEQTLTKLYLVKKLTPTVIENATQQLEKHFSVKDKQQDFLESALKNLEQEAA